MQTHPVTASQSVSPQVAVVGGGIAGSAAALKLSELGVKVSLFEAGPSLVNGPPACHLHAGGNLYREISDEQCLKLLEQSIHTLRVFPHAVNQRPTVISVPLNDPGEPEALLPRLRKVQAHYAKLIEQDSANQKLGPANDYYRLYSREQLEQLAKQEIVSQPQSPDEWMIPVAKHLDLSAFKFPFVQVQEYGLSLLRIAASVKLASERLANCQVFTHSRVTHIELLPGTTPRWRVDYSHQKGSHSVEVDYLINACGYRSGSIDDMAKLSRSRMVEFKAAYLANWPSQQGRWPELIVHGERGTPNGMAQLTPYPDGLFQLHGMTDTVTLFKGGLVSSSQNSAQPELNPSLSRKLTQGWQSEEVEQRTAEAVKHMSRYLPSFSNAEVAGRPLFGAQQIPGSDPSLRAASVSFDKAHYARTEIVKFSSALSAAEQIIENIRELGLLSPAVCGDLNTLQSTQGLAYQQVLNLAEQLAEQRNYPLSLAR
ncbi:FAD-dependent oxidoreductase [Agarivorans aestuarii]|uniref:FAD-dependent oxidoreductase n=1 Tax=Agarivorans aestuarii TaxID=1563703 RepID=A0ABU7G427_9ALTE|nr:FAD-dependent oxidoreductase [Agarivorans aestuarii]MEE1674159.1 FAD-dependent oxidoreductase [Agarivorans aestuarii]